MRDSQHRRALLWVGAAGILSLAAAAGGRVLASETPTVPPAFKAPTSTDVAGPEPAAPVPERLRLAFVGDLGLGGVLGQYVELRALGHDVPEGVGRAFPFDHVAERLRTADLTIGNLECVVEPFGRPLVKTAQPAPLEVLTPVVDAGFDIVSVANNHTMDFGDVAFRSMVGHVRDAGLEPAGVPKRDGHQDPVIVSVRGTRIAVLAYYSVLPSFAAEEIAQARPNADIVIVFNHWGTHWSSEPNAKQEELAREQVRAGADLVVGAHSHVLQPAEMLEGTLVVYGLGNFAFNGMNHRERFRRGGLLEVDFEGNDVVEHRFFATDLDELGAPHFVNDEPAPYPMRDRQ